VVLDSAWNRDHGEHREVTFWRLVQNVSDVPTRWNLAEAVGDHVLTGNRWQGCTVTVFAGFSSPNTVGTYSSPYRK